MNKKIMKLLFLKIEMLAEVIGISALKTVGKFSKLIPSIVVIFCYSISFFFLSLTLKSITVVIAYSIWSGACFTLILVSGYFLYKQSLDLPAIIGKLLIICELIVINLFF